MRKTAAILLLLSFTIAQYDRYISFMECKVVSYVSTSSEKCDCEKNLQQAAGAQTPLLPVAHIHNYTDTLYYPSLTLIVASYCKENKHSFITPADAALAEGIYSNIDHPPIIVPFLLFS
ncbi:MAG: hypothetical protein ABI480_14005 [Chitinophagaceae bacterium]